MIVIKEINTNELRLLEKKKEDFILYFNLPGCAPCRMIKPVLEELDYDVYKVNALKNQSLVLEYEIKSAPTLILFKNGKEVKRNVGFIELKDLKEKFEI